MITILSGKLTIPEEERFIGFIGDDHHLEKHLLLKHFSVPHSAYELCLRFDDGTERVIPLVAHRADADVYLTWQIRSEHLYSAGIVAAQLKIISGDGSVIHSTRDYFFVGSSEEESGEDPDPYVTHALLEEKLNIIRTQLPYADGSGAYIVSEDGDVKIARSAEVYTKDEIDGMIGDLEDILAQV